MTISTDRMEWHHHGNGVAGDGEGKRVRRRPIEHEQPVSYIPNLKNP